MNKHTSEHSPSRELCPAIASTGSRPWAGLLGLLLVGGIACGDSDGSAGLDSSGAATSEGASTSEAASEPTVGPSEETPSTDPDEGDTANATTTAADPEPTTTAAMTTVATTTSTEDSTSTGTDPTTGDPMGSSTGQACEPGEVACSAGCVDPQSDPDFCGAAGDCADANVGAQCVVGQTCVAGECQCDVGFVVCAGACVDPNSDHGFCGAGQDCEADPGVACPDGWACGLGLCFLPKQPPQTTG